MSAYTHSRAHCQHCSVLHAAVSQGCRQWCGVSCSPVSWTKGAMPPPGTSTSCWHSPGVRGALGLVGTAQGARQQVAPQPGGESLGWPRRQQAEFLRSLHCVLSTLSWVHNGVISLTGFSLMLVKPVQPSFQHRTGHRAQEQGLYLPFTPRKQLLANKA